MAIPGQTCLLLSLVVEPHSVRGMLKGQSLLGCVLVMEFMFLCVEGLVVATVFVPDTLWEPIHIFPPYDGMCGASPLLLKPPLVLNAKQRQWGCFLPADDKGRGGSGLVSALSLFWQEAETVEGSFPAFLLYDDVVNWPSFPQNNMTTAHERNSLALIS